MRIHSPAVLGPAWQITGRGVREVLIRSTLVDGALVSRRTGPFLHNAAGRARDFAANTLPALFQNLYRTEAEARAEFGRRQLLTRSPLDRRLRNTSPLMVNRAAGAAIRAAAE
jgi:hypothetical protein